MRILALTHRLPYAPNRGDRIRSFHLLKNMSKYAEVHLVSLAHDEHEANQAGALADLVASVDVARVPAWRNRVAAVPRLLGERPLTHMLLDSPAIRPALDRLVAGARPDLVFAYGSGMARFAFEPPLADMPCVVDLVDVDSAKWEVLAESAPALLSRLYRREARVLGRFERHILQRAYRTFVVNERELSLLPSSGRAQVLELGVDREFYAPPQTESSARQGVVVTGVFDYPPNAEGALWLARDVWPHVKRRLGEATLTFAGAKPTRALRAAASRDRSITVTGAVPDIRPYLWHAAVGAAPMRIARGVQNKVLEGVAAGLPFVATSAVVGGLPFSVRPAVTVADQTDQFADALVALLEQTADQRRQLIESLDLEPTGWPATLAPLEGILRSALGDR